ncbi:site-specific integrase [Akkermansia sp. N21116]|uniref:tyrosine-type recombinase/integrase n=1 Tax=Akkermansia sp. N21116 TaxID=3040764 RepID=UPI00244E6889|nr:site-specific integrase [Akkermansia sp. N21116]WPX39456.1 site-specific integrase [Akkermansia sp. N21116]
MSKPLKFTIGKLKRGKQTLYRIWIPEKFSANGKKTALYYKTKTAAENDQSALREKYVNGELSAGLLLGPGQVKDAQRAFEIIVESGIKLSLVDAVQIALEQRRAQLVGITVSELFEKYEKDASIGRNWSENHKKNWRFYASKFTGHFGERNIADVQAQELREWFGENYASATYFNSATAVISPAFSWAVKQEILKRSPFELIEKRKVVQADGVDVFTPEETRRLLSFCRPFLSAGPDHPMADDNGNVAAIYKLDCSDAVLPFSILLFAGIRPEELQKLTWDLIHLDKELISVPPSIAKTNQVRNVELHDNLRRYLESVPVEQREGKIIPQNWKRKAAIVRKAANLQNRPDAPRHSFASYSLAVDPNIDRLRENMGHTKNSDVLFKHYRTAVRKTDALEFWSIDPEDPYGKKEKPAKGKSKAG